MSNDSIGTHWIRNVRDKDDRLIKMGHFHATTKEQHAIAKANRWTQVTATKWRSLRIHLRADGVFVETVEVPERNYGGRMW